MGRLPQIQNEDPTGRLDILLIRLVDEFVTSRGDFALRALHARYKPAIHHVIHEWCGPVRIPGLPLESAGRRLRAEPRKPASKAARSRTKAHGPVVIEMPAAIPQRDESDIIDAEWEDIPDPPKGAA